MFHIVLFEPEIPQNTGNISRTCSVTDCELHLVEPLGFSIDDKHVKRAGLDYWDTLKLSVHPDFDDVIQRANPSARFFLSTTKGAVPYTSAKFSPGDYLVFGRETAGLPDFIHRMFPDTRIRIPMLAGKRSLNLSNSVAVVLYEALRQNGFGELK